MTWGKDRKRLRKKAEAKAKAEVKYLPYHSRTKYLVT
jgi:hypothetical protein